ncbi:MFS transporter [Umezawaea sp. NPDC059074]|uniref:MFS transporter n=1 Tax=Umezawaea sp. NPDC059074 TaxID=3346716 RepID=UPI00367C61E8
MSEASVETPLARNRNYNILWSSLLFSELNNAILAIAFPLLVLATSGSVAELGVVLTVLAAATMLATVPAGVVADRWNRKRVMLVCQAVRIVSLVVGCLVVLRGLDPFPYLVAMALLEGLAGSVFAPAEDAALPQVVPTSQLSQAIARNTARPFVANLLGPVAAGLLFGVHHVLPFLLGAAMLFVSFAALLFLSLPYRAEVEEDEEAGVGADLVEGFRWVLRHPVIRATMVWLVFTQLFFSALVLIVLTASGEYDLAPGVTGVMMAFLGAGGILGAVFASKMVDLLPSSVIVVGFTMVTAAMTAVMALVPPGIPLGLVLFATAFFIPVTATTVMTYQMVVTPDELRGRLSGIVGLGAEGASALGPLAGTAMVVLAGGRSTTSLLVCGACLAVVAVGSLLSPTLRRFPSVRETEDAPHP